MMPENLALYIKLKEITNTDVEEYVKKVIRESGFDVKEYYIHRHINDNYLIFYRPKYSKPDYIFQRTLRVLKGLGYRIEEYHRQTLGGL